MPSDEYFVYSNGGFKKIALDELAKRLSLPPEIRISKYSNDGKYTNLWSARLSSGLFGLASCEAGNRGPKGYSEVLLSVGDEGLNKLVELGFITCPVCKPENVDGLWDVVKDIVKQAYGLGTLDDFIDKKLLPFDARRVAWEKVLPTTGKAPNRIYLPKGLAMDEVVELQRRFTNIGFSLPPVGYYNPDVAERFTEYKLPTS
jgi:hypothetical protein